MSKQIVNPKDVWRLCVDCSRSIYGTVKPTDLYANRVAHLLFGTAAKESNSFRASRQYDIDPKSARGIDWHTNLGGFGLWQLEWVSVAETIKRLSSLSNHHQLRARCAEWLFLNEDAEPEWYARVGKWAMLHNLCGWHRAACMFARLHYIWEPSPVPTTVGEHAAYWKKYYNTSAGKGTPQEYVRAWAENMEAIKGQIPGGT